MMRYLVTGGAGFIGSALCHRLAAEGRKVVVLDDFSTGDPERLAAIRAAVTLIEGDIRDRAAVDRAMRGVGTVFHEAALPSVARSVEDPLASNDVNVSGTLTVLESARRAGVRRLVYAASSSAYGDTPALPKREDMKPSPRSPYAIGKLAGEHYAEAYFRLFGLETVSLRYFNVFGPRQDPRSHYAAVIPRFITAALAGAPATIYGDGLQSRDFTFVDNVVDANLRAAEASGAPGHVFNIACGRRYTLLDLLAMIAAALGRDAPVPPVHEPDRPGDVRHSLADIAAARAALGYEPAIDMQEGIRRTVDWYRQAAAR
ncbi:MAG TPA: LPS biosynthesis protein WbpP [Planctomycetes bacterium]|nr:LPS biosynthesis protein WbpP [Planctomycetota bacterium]